MFAPFLKGHFLFPPFVKGGQGGFQNVPRMLRYVPDLKRNSRGLRKNLTDSENVLWSRLRRKQLEGVQFYRQKPIGKYIVDFFAPAAHLVIEVDGSQHLQEDHMKRDHERDEDLIDLGLEVLRFNSRQVLTETAAVVEVILRRIKEQLNP
jgi:very-short-patch-repair endonuclease